jgi:hypothetical protein
VQNPLDSMSLLRQCCCAEAKLTMSTNPAAISMCGRVIPLLPPRLRFGKRWLVPELSKARWKKVRTFGSGPSLAWECLAEQPWNTGTRKPEILPLTGYKKSATSNTVFD